MTRKAGLLLLVACVVFLAACSSADASITKITEALNKQTALVKADKFKADDFKKDLEPAVKEFIAQGKNSTYSKPVMDGWEKACKEWGEAVNEKQNAEANKAYVDVVATPLSDAAK